MTDTLTEEEALKILWEGKVTFDPKKVRFLFAETTKEVTMRIWNQQHPVEKNTTLRVVPPGTKVLVTVVSRFGDVGIRDDAFDDAKFTYYSRVQPAELTNWRL